jgi:hypothetical protein
MDAAQNAFNPLGPILGPTGAGMVAQFLSPYLSNYLGNPMGNIGMTSGMGHYYGSAPYEAMNRIGQAGQQAQTMGYQNLARNVTGMLGPEYAGAENTIAGAMSYAQGLGVPMPNIQGGDPNELAQSVQRAFPRLQATKLKPMGGDRSTWELLTGAAPRPKVYDHTPTAEDGELYFNSVYRNMVDDKGAVNQEYARGFDMGEVGTMMEEMAKQRAFNPFKGGASAEENISKQTGEMIELMETMKESFGSPDSSVFELIDVMNDVFGDNSLVRLGAERMTKVVQELEATRVQMGMTKDELRDHLQKGTQIAAGYGHRQEVGVQATQYALDQTEVRRRKRQDAIANGTVDPYEEYESDEEFMERKQHSYNQSFDSDIAKNAGVVQNAIDRKKEELGENGILKRLTESREVKGQRAMIADVEKAIKDGNVDWLVDKYKIDSEAGIDDFLKQLGLEHDAPALKNNWKRGRNRIAAENPDFIAGIQESGFSKIGEQSINNLMSNKNSSLYEVGLGGAFEYADADVMQDVLRSEGDLFTGTEESKKAAAKRAALKASRASGEFDTLSYTERQKMRTRAGDRDFFRDWNEEGLVHSLFGRAYGYVANWGEADETDKEKAVRHMAGVYQTDLEAAGTTIEDDLAANGASAEQRLKARTEMKDTNKSLMEVRQAAKKAEANGDKETATMAAATGTILSAVMKSSVTGKEPDWDKIMGSAVRMGKDNMAKEFDNNEELRNRAAQMGINSGEDLHKMFQLSNTNQALQSAKDKIDSKHWIVDGLGLSNTWVGWLARSDDEEKARDDIAEKQKDMQLEYSKLGGVGKLAEGEEGRKQLSELMKGGGEMGEMAEDGGERNEAIEAQDKRRMQVKRQEHAEKRKKEMEDYGREGDRLSMVLTANDTQYDAEGKKLTTEEISANRNKKLQELQGDFFTDEERAAATEIVDANKMSTIAAMSALTGGISSGGILGAGDEYDKHLKSDERQVDIHKLMVDQLKKTDPARAAEYEKKLAQATRQSFEDIDAEIADAEEKTLVGGEAPDEATAYADIGFSDSKNASTYTAGERIGGDIGRTRNEFAGGGTEDAKSVAEQVAAMDLSAPQVAEAKLAAAPTEAITPVEEAVVTPAEEAAATAAVAAGPEAVGAPEVKVEEAGAGTEGRDGEGAGIHGVGTLVMTNDMRRQNDEYQVDMTLTRKGAG